MLFQHLNRAFNRFHFVLAATLLACSPLFAQESEAEMRGLPQELKKLHVLLVIDTESELKESVLHDRDNVEEMLKQFIPEKMRDITVLEGKKLSRQAVLDYYRRLKVGSDESLLFFYAGHGAIDPKQGQYFPLQNNKDPLLRKEVLQIMKEKNAGLAVLLTDCCSSLFPLSTKVRGTERLVYDKRPHPILRSLFFQHKGVVDLTGAQDGTGSWGDRKQGGVFTQAFCGLLHEQLKNLDSNKDGFLSWKEFFGLLEHKTEEAFAKWCERLSLAERAEIHSQQRTQKPRSFGPLPEPIRAAKPDSKNEKNAFAVIHLVNKTGKTLSYRYRWDKSDTWKEGKLEKEGQKYHEQPVKASLAENQLPRLEVEIPSENTRTTLQPRKWIGVGKPTVWDSREFELTSSD